MVVVVVEVVVVVVVLVVYISLHTQGGIYFFQLMDYYTAAISLMFVALFETIAIVWCYGTKAGREPNSQNHSRLTGQIIFWVGPRYVVFRW